MTQPLKKALLISNKVFHYRVANYNYFARRLREHGWEFCVRASELEANNPIPVEFDFRVMPFGFFRYAHEIERIAPDVVILFMRLKELMIWPLVHWLKIRGIPFVYWNKGVNLEVRNPRFRNWFFYYIHGLGDAIILYSKHEIRTIRPRNRGKVFVANNTINFESFPEITLSKEELKREFGIPFAKVVLFVGRMRPLKKVEHLVEVFNRLDEPWTGCVVVGDAMGYDLSSMIKTRNIMYLGEIHDPKNLRISKLFKLADIFCIPGDVGLGLNQAFYWGLPVVTEDGLQPPEIHYLVNGRNGFIVPENDVEELKERILELIRNDDMRAQFSRNAHEDIMREASIETMLRGLLDCLTACTSMDSLPRAAQRRN